MTDGPKSYATEDVDETLGRLAALAEEHSPDESVDLDGAPGLTEANYIASQIYRLVSELQKKAIPGSPQLAVQRYFESLKSETAQDAAWDRNSWQRRLGAVVTYIEEAVRRWHDPRSEEVRWKVVLDKIYGIINTNPLTGRIDDPYADIAVMATKQTVLACMEAGMIVPGPDAPAWLRRATGEVVEEESNKEEDGDEEDEA